MFCNKCGNKLSPESIFCNRCGSRTISENLPAVPDQYSRGEDYDRQPLRPAMEARPAAANYAVAEDHVIFTLKPTLIFVWVLYFVAAVIWIGVAALLGLIFGLFTTTGIIILLIIGVVLFAFPAYKHLIRSREVYTLTNHHLQMRFGLIAKTVRNIPVTKIQDVTVTAAVWQRLLNIGDIEIDSASEGGKIILDNIHYPDRYADMILAEARRRN